MIALHIADLGGEERLSENQLSLCRRVATIETELEMLEGQLSLGKVADLDLYNRLSGNLRRILESLGLERVARPVNDGSAMFWPTISAGRRRRKVRRHDERCFVKSSSAATSFGRSAHKRLTRGLRRP